MQEKTRRERGQFFAKGKLMVVSTEWWHPVDIDQYAYRKLENIWPAFVIFGLVRCIYIFVRDICWITREAGEKRRTAKERAAILLAYFLLQYILSWKPFAWDMICTKFLVHYFSLMFSIFAEETFILEVGTFYCTFNQLCCNGHRILTYFQTIWMQHHNVWFMVDVCYLYFLN